MSRKDMSNAKKLCEERNWRVGDLLSWKEDHADYLCRITSFGESVVVLRRPKCAEFVRQYLPINTVKIPRVKA